MLREEEKKAEVLAALRPSPSSGAVSPSELRDLYRKVNGTLLQLRGMLERLGVHV